MIPQIQIPEWRKVLRQNFVDFSKLADFLELSEEQRKAFPHRSKFILNLPLRLAQKIEKRNVEDPLFKQFVPTMEENTKTLNFTSDPVGDAACRRCSKLLHKYRGRVLLLCTSACAMHCRYCFRQHFDYDCSVERDFGEELKFIQLDKSINEVILSGGDPLSLDDRILKKLLDSLAGIEHVRKVRFHTRFPIGIPERIDASFLALLKSIPLQFWFVVHINHPSELDEDVFKALKAIQQLGIPVLNQSVLLRGINDDVEILANLCESLVDNGIIPYYLHHLDRVQGAAHFEVPEQLGINLIASLRDRLPGYAVPKYVKELAGHAAKTPIVL